MDLDEVMKPAIFYAENGFPVSPNISRLWEEAFGIYSKYKDRPEFAPWFETFAPKNTWLRPGEMFANPDMAKSLRLIAKTHGEAFYKGELAERTHDFFKKHNGFLTGVLDAFRQTDLLAWPLSAHAALRDIRTCIAPELTSRNWKALMPGDPLPLRLPDPEAGDERHNMLYPDFRTQLWPEEGQLLSRNAIRIGDRIYGPLIMTLMPQTPKPFQELFRILARRDERLPYRISFLIEDGGLRMGLRPLLSTLLAFTSSDNKRFNKAVDVLRALNLEGMCCVKFRICLCTWASVRELPEQEAFLLLRRRVAELAKTVQGWAQRMWPKLLAIRFLV